MVRYHRAVAKVSDTHGGKALLHVGAGHRAGHLGVQLVHHVTRGRGRRHQRIPRDGLEARKALLREWDKGIERSLNWV
jgi:hypothetical protein